MSNKKPVAFLTTDDLHGHVTDDHLAVEPLQALGRPVAFVSWRGTGSWADYAGVVIRSTWDYTEAAGDFIQTLSQQVSGGTRLANPLSVVRWNLDKSYLKDLARAGVPVVPTLWPSALNAGVLSEATRRFGQSDLVVKPVLGASARDTFLIRDGFIDNRLLGRFENQPCMVQPYLEAIATEGEYSLFYFGGTLSHAISKRPARGDFRVQEEHGGQLAAIEPDASMLACAQKALAVVAEPTLYARVDLVRTQAGLAVMELELIEPSLYLRLCERAPENLAMAVERWLSANQ